MVKSAVDYCCVFLAGVVVLVTGCGGSDSKQGHATAILLENQAFFPLQTSQTQTGNVVRLEARYTYSVTTAPVDSIDLSIASGDRDSFNVYVFPDEETSEVNVRFCAIFYRVEGDWGIDWSDRACADILVVTRSTATVRCQVDSYVEYGLFPLQRWGTMTCQA